MKRLTIILAIAVGYSFAMATPLLFAEPARNEVIVTMTDEPVKDDCTCRGKRLYGKVKIVTSFADFKVKAVTSFPDLKVKMVSAFADDCGEWQIVESFPDFTIQFVESFPDFTIKFVESFPGL